MGMKRWGKALLWLLAVALLALALGAALHAGHDCTGTRCLVCAIIHQSHKILGLILGAVVLALFVYAPVMGSSANAHGHFLPGALVAQKTRMNN